MTASVEFVNAESGTETGAEGLANGSHNAPRAETRARIAVLRLSLSAFRNYASGVIETDGRSVVLTGPNGAGKTNLLEALSLLAPGRGLRRAAPAEIQMGGDAEAPGWAVAAVLDTPAGPMDVGTGRVGTADRRIVKVEGEVQRSQAVLAELAPLLWLTPQMDGLFIEGASARRRFLDRLAYGVDPSHAGRVSAYERAMRERNRLLKAGNRDDSWLSGLEEAMAERSVAIAAARRELVERLERTEDSAAGTFPAASLALDGEVERMLVDRPAVGVEDAIRGRLAEARNGDALSGGAAIGAHRCDLKVRHVAKDMPADLCSTGEQKALLISIVLANARLQASRHGIAPLLLLDDVAAHLDDERRAGLFDEIEAIGSQAWLTGTDVEAFAALGARAQKFTVRDAALQPAAPPAA